MKMSIIAPLLVGKRGNFSCKPAFLPQHPVWQALLRHGGGNFVHQLAFLAPFSLFCKMLNRLAKSHIEDGGGNLPPPSYILPIPTNTVKPTLVRYKQGIIQKINFFLLLCYSQIFPDILRPVYALCFHYAVYNSTRIDSACG